jgi:hypothetical protein
MTGLNTRKTGGTGLSASHIGKDNLNAIKTATDIGQPLVGVPANPAPGGWTIFIGDGSGEDVPRNGIAIISTNWDGRTTIQPLVGGMPGPLE